MGILITYKDRDSKFWYGCDRKQIRKTVRDHFASWPKDANGPIDPAHATVVYVTEWAGDEIKASEPVEHLAMIK